MWSNIAFLLEILTTGYWTVTQCLGNPDVQDKKLTHPGCFAVVGVLYGVCCTSHIFLVLCIPNLDYDPPHIWAALTPMTVPKALNPLLAVFKLAQKTTRKACPCVFRRADQPREADWFIGADTCSSALCECGLGTVVPLCAADFLHCVFIYLYAGHQQRVWWVHMKRNAARLFLLIHPHTLLIISLKHTLILCVFLGQWCLRLQCSA